MHTEASFKTPGSCYVAVSTEEKNATTSRTDKPNKAKPAERGCCHKFKHWVITNPKTAALAGCLLVGAASTGAGVGIAAAAGIFAKSLEDSKVAATATTPHLSTTPYLSTTQHSTTTMPKLYNDYQTASCRDSEKNLVCVEKFVVVEAQEAEKKDACAESVRFDTVRNTGKQLAHGNLANLISTEDGTSWITLSRRFVNGRSITLTLPMINPQRIDTVKIIWRTKNEASRNVKLEYHKPAPCNNWLSLGSYNRDNTSAKIDNDDYEQTIRLDHEIIADQLRVTPEGADPYQREGSSNLSDYLIMKKFSACGKGRFTSSPVWSTNVKSSKVTAGCGPDSKVWNQEGTPTNLTAAEYCEKSGDGLTGGIRFRNRCK